MRVKFLILLTFFAPFSIIAEHNVKAAEDELQKIELIIYPTNDTLKEIRNQYLQLIQEQAQHVRPLTFMKYIKTVNCYKAEALEDKFQVLEYFKNVTNRSINAIESTKVEKGLICWYFYNMGYVFQTATSIIGVDLSFRDAEKLASFLDVLLITHWHHDHYDKRLVEKMLEFKKPVFSNFYPHSVIVKKDTVITLGNNTISMCIGDHHRQLPLISSKNMLQYQISYRCNNDKFTIYHTGDGNNIKKMKTTEPVDIFIVHTQLPMPLSKAVYHVKPKITFASHVLELSHPFPFRWNYDYCYKQISKIKDFNVITLAWGERWCSENAIISSK